MNQLDYYEGQARRMDAQSNGGRDNLSFPLLRVSLSGLRRNWRRVRQVVRSEAAIAAVIKSDAYGLGCKAVADVLWSEGCQWFFVGTLKEAEQCRQWLPMSRISVLYPLETEEPEQYYHLRVEPVISSWGVLTNWTSSVCRGSVLLNIDTGLGRSGLGIAQVARLQSALESSALKVGGVLSHLAVADRSLDPFNKIQKDRFDAVLRRLQPPMASLAASAGIMLGQDYHYDFVRVGSFLFGDDLIKGGENPTEPLVKILAPVLDIFELPAHESIGYERTEVVPWTRRIATVLLGYGHGYPARLRGPMHVACCGILVPIIGGVSMEQLTIDVTRIPINAIHPGMSVEVVNHDLTLTHLANQSDRTPLELMLGFGSRLTREYTDEDIDSLKIIWP